MRFLARLTERLIDKAAEDGVFDHLPGAGKPLPEKTRDGAVDAAEEIGYRLMAENGAIPPEVQVMRDLAAARARLKACDDPEDRRRLMTEVSRIQLRHDMMMEQRRRSARYR
ncbi:DUF1992 domain-containing protein [Wenxinia saemankumensis]|uniref:DnaJ homologue subfamily C member 28 conserved domain-containing protein n=1 Tax=Wenxinia saemankumensis TaxID=1447782 RepID=A0A1M6CSP6_9RHOB|nr:DUF1992 domain-containing protein [Wenxinia saemankumensis]SHI63814.1 protein of unknown function [Wenxinia saemankumensis]